MRTIRGDETWGVVEFTRKRSEKSNDCSSKLRQLPQQQWIRDAGGNPLFWPVDDYHLEGKRVTKWFIKGVIKYHRTVETYVTTLISRVSPYTA
jgi:hypothetical protein